MKKGKILLTQAAVEALFASYLNVAVLRGAKHQVFDEIHFVQVDDVEVCVINKESLMERKEGR